MEIAWGFLGIVVVIALWVGFFGTLIGKIVSYLSLFFIVRFILGINEDNRSHPRSTAKIIGYCLAAVLCVALAVNEIRDHKHSCAGSYNADVSTSGKPTDNAFAQGTVNINENNRSEVCSSWVASKACKEYDTCLGNPLYSIFLFLFIAGACVTGTLFLVELRKSKASNGVEQTGAPNNINNVDAVGRTASTLEKTTSELLDEIKPRIPTMTVAELAKETGKTERGIRAHLTRHGINAKDYDGAAKKAKAMGSIKQGE